ncbi:U6 snRNA-associated Sm-like protein LSm7 [Plasmodium yoelii yoelii]|uniref:U6 snRNA-associated Sm-like protein LSm7 n=1 Tax=Plasmodium yoelii yoelii TaxID=73239 RepID=A0AAE9WKY8_PLAYO|nr:U6 snRNA-associated Sm-like protein LSm7 [Plasmodium yoelii yoelii]
MYQPFFYIFLYFYIFFFFFFFFFFLKYSVVGNLIGHDAIFNLVLDKTEEFIRDPNDSYVITEKSRNIGLIVARGTSVALITPVNGTQEISNPFISEEK